VSLLAPLFLIGLAAIALPVWLHRLQTQSPERKPFGSAMFLEPSERRVHLKKPFRFLVLLALRILLLALLAFAFAKPILQQPPQLIAGEVPTLHLIVIDTSFSMGHGDRMNRAKRIAHELINAKAVADQTQIISAGGSIERAAPATNNGATARQAVAALEPGAGRLDFGALIAGLGGLVGDVERHIAVHLVSDFQASGLPARFGDLVPGPINDHDQRAVALNLHPVVAGTAANWTVEFVRETVDGLDVGVRGFNTEEQQQELALFINGRSVGQRTQPVPAAGQAVYSFDNIEYEPGDNRIEASLTANDLLAADDTRYAVVDNTPPAPVLLITTSKQSLPVTYLSVALATGPRGYRAEPVTIAELDPRVLQRYPWIIIDDLGAVNDNLARAITAYLNAGGAVLSALGEQAVTHERLPVTGHRVGEANIAAGIAALRSVDWIDASHPALARTRGWRSVNVARALPLITGDDDRVLMTLADGQPLLLEHRRGDGRMLLLTTSLDNSWTDLPVHPVFVGFIAEAAAYLADEAVLDRQQRAGALLVLKQTRGASGQVVDPGGRTVLKLADTRRAQEVRLDQTGFYEVYTPGREALVAVNADPRESDLATMSPEALARWRSAVARPERAATRTDGAAALQAPPLELWWWLLIVLALVVLAESLLGNRYLGLGADAN